MRSDGSLQRQARKLVQSMHVATQALRLYPVENATVQQALSNLHRVATDTLVAEGPLELRTSGDFLYLNEVRLRTDLSSLETFGGVARTFGRHGVGCVRIDPEVGAEEWAPLFTLALGQGGEGNAFEAFAAGLADAGVRHIGVTEARTVLPAGIDDAGEERVRSARRAYIDGVRVLDELRADLQRTGACNIRKAKRAVQGLVDRVLVDEASMLAMTTLREFDAYPLTHGVNTCIFGLVIGRKLGLAKPDLFQLGLAGYFADIGMSGVRAELRDKATLTADEWEEVKAHTRHGLRLLFDMRGFAEPPYRAMLAAYEHHMGAELNGYPEVVRERSPTLFSRIVAVADGFDAALSERSYRYAPKPPDRILLEMENDPQWGMDPLVTKVFIGVLGAYPVGTLVLLDTGELAVVAARNALVSAIWRPVVKVLTDENGVGLPEPVEVDLTEEDPVTGRPRRSVERALEARKYGVHVGTYFL